MKYINGKYYGISTEIDDINDAEDLAIFNCLDTGMQYRFFEGRWYKQPVYWVDRDNAGGGGGGVEYVHYTVDDDGNYSCDHTAKEIYELVQAGKYCVAMLEYMVMPVLSAEITGEGQYQVRFSYFDVNRDGETWYEWRSISHIYFAPNDELITAEHYQGQLSGGSGGES